MYAVYDFFFLLPCLNLTILSVSNTSCGKKEFSCSLPTSAMLWAGSGGGYKLDAWSSSVMAGRQLLLLLASGHSSSCPRAGTGLSTRVAYRFLKSHIGFKVYKLYK